MKFTASLLICLSTALLSLDSLSQTYFLNGDAIDLGNDCYQLTDASTNQNGTVWYGEQLDLTEPFNLEFTMNFGVNDFNGADGMVFVLQNVGTNAIGDNGEGIGFSGFSPSLGIEFDTYQNTNLGDPSQDHCSIMRNGDVNHLGGNNLAGPVVTSALSNNVEDGLDHIVRIEWDPEVQDIEVWFDCELRLITGVDLVDDIFQGQSDVWFGFTAATGGEVNTQSVCLQENILAISEDVNICNGAEIQLNAAGNPNGNFLWTPSTGLDDDESQTPIASPSETTAYTVTYTDLCDNEQSNTVTVNVEELNVTGEVSGILNCYEPIAEIEAQNNFSDDIEYIWTTDDGVILSGEETEVITTETPGTYTVSANFQDACFADANFVVDADLDSPGAEIDPAVDIDCLNTSITLNASTNMSLVDIQWSTDDGFILDGESTLTPTITDGGLYRLTITDPENGCSSEDEITIQNLIEFPIAEAGLNDTIACLNPIAELNGGLSSVGPEFNYLWTSQNGAISENEANMLDPGVAEPGTYFLTVTNSENSCTSVDSVVVFLDETALLDPELISFPNVFTPNGDSINDIFKPIIEDIEELLIPFLVDNFELRVFNRWGNLLYESTGNVIFWDGRMPDGSLPSDGVYYYTVRFDFLCGDGSEEERNGLVQIITQ